ncbi:MAG: T9SS type A sorting domain-containing protein [Saprospiraceae bacterium]
MKHKSEHIKPGKSKHISFLFMCLAFVLGVTNLASQACPPSFSCNSNIQVSLDINCTEEIKASSMLKELTFPESEYTVTIKNKNGKILSSNIIDKTYIGQRLEVSVKLNRCGYSCWGYAWIEDKLPPVITNCDTVEVDCDADLRAGFGVPNITAFDACGPATIKQLPDVVTPLPCSSPFIKRIERPWLVTDVYGNTATCIQVINVRRFTLDDITAPPNYDDFDRPALVCGVFNHFLPNGAPDPVYTGFPGGIHCDNIQQHYVDTRFELCGSAFKILRVWEVIDWCNGRDTTFGQIIKYLDKIPPVCTVNPNDVVVLQTDPKKCTATYKVPPPKATDCSAFSYIVGYRLRDHLGGFGDTIYTKDIVRNSDNTFTLTALPQDTTIIIYKLTDGCGNISYCSFDVHVKDKESPSANCEGYIVVSLRENGWAELTATALNSGSEDNCGIVKYEIRRLDTNCPNYPQDRTLRDKVNFCCTDVNADPTKYIKVVLRVTDAAGNTNECISNVRVQDKIKPVITCPADITIQCYVDYKDSTKTNGVATAIDNCMATILPFKDDVRLDKCGIGVVIRKWVAVDKQGLRDSCFQYITVVNDNPFSEDHIIFPADTIVNQCVDAAKLTPEYLDSKPKFVSKTCADLAVSYTDEYYTVDNACQKILRYWRVINWCDYNPNDKNYYTHTQKILVQDNVGPVFISGCVDRTIVSKEGDCEEEVHHRVEAHDECTPDNKLKYSWEVDLFSNQTIDRVGVGPAVSEKYPVGKHRMIFRVIDACGNVTKCEYMFLIKDDKKPTPVCIGELVWVLDKDGKAEVWASDFNLKSEDFCATGELTYAFNQQNTQKSRFFTCADVPNGIAARIPLRMYVFDSDGNFEFCSVILVLQDSPTTNGCADNLNGGATISGKIINNKLDGVKGVSLTLSDIPNAYEEIIKTDELGNFAFSNKPFFSNFMLMPEKMDESKAGVNTLDLVFLQRHILSISRLNTPYQQLAADVNNDKKIDIADLVALRKIILGVTDNYGQNKPWRFIPSNFKFESVSTPFDLVDYKVYDTLMVDDLGADFLIFKVGDIDANYSAVGTFGRSRNTLDLVTETIGNDVVVRAANDVELSGLQLTLDLDKNASIVGNRLDIKSENYFLKHGVANISWTSKENISIKEGDILFTIKNDQKVTLNENGEISSEAYNSDYETLQINWNATTIKKSDEKLSIYPNPFAESTTVEFELKNKGLYEIKVFDQQGKLIYSTKKEGLIGLNKEVLPKQKLNEVAGIYFVRLESSEYTKTVRVIMTE